MAGIDLGNLISFACGALALYALQNPRKMARLLRGIFSRAHSGASKMNERYRTDGMIDPRLRGGGKDDDRDGQSHPEKSRRRETPTDRHRRTRRYD